MTLVIDGNLEIFRALHVVSEFGQKQYSGSLGDERALIRKILYDIVSIHNAFGFVDRLIVVFDSKNSWRKSIPIEENDGYKSGRHQNKQQLDWNRFFLVIDELIDNLKTKGIPVLQIPRAEGDDLLFLVSRYLKEHNQNCVLVTTDKDIHQCVYHTSTSFGAVYGGTSQDRKLFVHTGFLEWLESKQTINLFDSRTFSGNTGRDIVKTAIKQNSITVTEINPLNLVFCKVLAGDRGDSVPPVLRWSNKKDPTKKWGATELKAQLVWDTMENVHPDILFERLAIRTNVAATLIDICKCSEEANIDDVVQKIERNLRLVYLSESTIPKDIQNKFDLVIEHAMNQPKPVITMETLVENTRFNDDQNQVNTIDILTNLDDIQ